MRLLVTASVALVVSLLLVASARACSCAGSDLPPLADADAAIVGTVVAADAGERRYTVAVEHVYKGAVGAQVELVTSDDTCGVDLAVGTRRGFLLYGDGPEYGVVICSITTPSALALAALPAPHRRAGTARLLVAGDLRGSSHLMALTADGRRLGSIRASAGDVIDACPGGRYVVQAGTRLNVIRMRDLRLVRATKLPADVSVGVRCLDPRGYDATALTAEYDDSDGPARPLRLVSVSHDRARTVARARGSWFSLGARSLAAARGGRVMTYQYRSGDARVALRLAGVGGVSWSPDGRNLAALASHAGYGAIAVKHADGSVSRRRVVLTGRAFDAVDWIGPDRLAVVEMRAGTGHLFTTGLRSAGILADWDLPGEVTAGAVWTLDGERIRRLALDGSGARLIGRRIAGARVIGVIPEGARVDASGAGARSSTTRSTSCPARASSSPSASPTSTTVFAGEPAGSGLFLDAPDP